MTKSRKKKILLAAFIFLPVILLATYKVTLLRINTLPISNSPVPKTTLFLQPELRYAIHNYQKNGNRYKWGSNDCSTFVTDYMRAAGKPTFKRLVTRDLYHTATMQFNGFIPTQESNLRPGDIIVYRYTGRYNTMQGHVGIVIDTGEDLKVVHNSLSSRGVTIDTTQEFLTKARSVADKRNKSPMVKIFTREDYAKWQSQYDQRKNQTKANPTNS